MTAADALAKGDARPLLSRPNENRASGEALDRQARELVARNDSVALAQVVRTFEAMVVSRDEIRALRMPVAVVVGTADVPKERVDAFMGLKPELKVMPPL